MSKVTEELQARMFELADEGYKEFHKGLIPGYDTDRLIGVRTPALRKLAGEFAKRPDIGEFLRELPHKYYEENNAHGFIISKTKDFGLAVKQTEAFLPYIDNWATCDCWAPKVFAKHTDELLPHITNWLASDHTYTVRYGIGTLMRFYLDENFKPEYCEAVASVSSDEYYIKMMIAGYFATALAKQYDTAVRYLEEKKLSEWVQNKTIQKAVESFRIDDKTKDYLRSLRIKG